MMRVRYLMILAIPLMLGVSGAATRPMPLAPSPEALLFVQDGSILTQERYVVHVPEDYPTIQAAVDAVAEGGTVLIGPGMYKENVQIRKSLRLVGAGQERVHIQYKDPDRPIIHVVSEATVQLHLQDLTIGDPTFPIEQVVVPPTPTSPRLLGIGLSIFAPVQMILRQVTIAGLASGVSGSGSYHRARFPSQIILEEVNLVRNGIGLYPLEAQVLGIRSKIEENLVGILSIEQPLSLSQSSVSRNRLGVALASSGFGPQFMGFIIDTEFRQNGVGISLGSRIEGDWIMIGSNRFVQNEWYGLVVEDPACPIDSELPLPPKSAPIQIFGGGNEFRTNGQDLCPADYPWPPGFRK